MLSSWTLRRIERDDLSVITAWIQNEEALTRWAGSNLSWPIDEEALWTMLDSAESLPLVMATDHDVMAFGQILALKPDTLHLSLLVVSPEFRGRRLGEHMSLALLKRGMARWPSATHVTLDVGRDDKAALAMSRRLGFQEAGAPEDAVGRVPLVHVLQTRWGDGRS